MCKNIEKEREITIEFTNDPGVEVLQAIAYRHGQIADKVLRGLNSIIQRAKNTTGYFAVILKNGAGEVIGFADFIQSRNELATAMQIKINNLSVQSYVLDICRSFHSAFGG